MTGCDMFRETEDKIGRLDWGQIVEHMSAQTDEFRTVRG